ncbi:Siroheme synthase [Tsuneonella dongtanensis]|uniref:precorrin-2 dehydrogenase n=1 Tax=Tsuneonella dongtanensis TaxID=692370 RepID=A0A1B2AD55_9SPHN|nr:NAD(P)-dependent oxidoreductase [Tsuneonella dongtanensis]ANY20067.1 Siroheme synthase [Tsuneonella dongtanensis]
MALNSLPLFHRIAGKRVVVLGDGDAAEAKRRLVERAGGICCGEPEAHHASLAFVAVDDQRQAEAAAIRLRCKGLLVNVTDRPELCDFTVPSILDREPVILAVGTGGASAGLAKQLRLQLERLLPPSLGRLAIALQSARAAMRERWPDAAGRRRALDVALAPGGVLDPLSDGADERVDSWLHGSHDANASGTREILLASADPDDLTLRQARWLGEADTVLHDDGVPASILDRARADAVRGPVDGDPGGLTVVIRFGP